MAQKGREKLADSMDVSDDADNVYKAIKEMISELKLRPGTTIREADLQEQLGIRRTPLREALRRLSHERMVQIYPRHGIVISTLGISEISEIYEVRLVLEVAAAGLAAQRRTAEELRELQSLLAQMHESYAAGDFERWNSVHRPFHLLLVRCSRNGFLEQYVEHLLTLNTWFWNIYEDTRGDRVASYSSHDELVEAIAAGDSAAAEEAMREHILGAKERLMGGL